MIFRTDKKSGFTLIEIIVSLMIFSVVAVVAVGALLKIVSLNRRAQTLQASTTNLSFAMEAISRELRVGSKFNCQRFSGTFNPGNDSGVDMAPNACSPSTDEDFIAFESSAFDTDKPTCRLVYAYRFVPTTTGYILTKAEQAKCGDTLDSTSFSSVIDPNVTITGYKITATDKQFPMAFIRITGYSGAPYREKEKSYFDVETAVSARIE